MARSATRAPLSSRSAKKGTTEKAKPAAATKRKPGRTPGTAKPAAARTAPKESPKTEAEPSFENFFQSLGKELDAAIKAFFEYLA